MPMMFMFLDKNRNGGGMDSMGMFMMMSMMGNNSSIQNPFANMFGQSPFVAPQPASQPVAPQPTPQMPTTADEAIDALLSDPETRQKIEEALKK